MIKNTIPYNSGDNSAGESQLAAFVALHLVSQVLDEAYIIANAAMESGQPWRYVSILRNLRSGRLGNADDGYPASDAIIQDNSLNAEHKVNTLATSTPQKMADAIEIYNDSGFAGQGDGEYESPQSNLSKATSMFINNLFDMSEVERLEDESISPETDKSAQKVVFDSMSMIMESCVNAALDVAKINTNEDIGLIDEIKPIEDSTGSYTDNGTVEGLFYFGADATPMSAHSVSIDEVSNNAVVIEAALATLEKKYMEINEPVNGIQDTLYVNENFIDDRNNGSKEIFEKTKNVSNMHLVKLREDVNSEEIDINLATNISEINNNVEIVLGDAMGPVEDATTSCGDSSTMERLFYFETDQTPVSVHSVSRDDEVPNNANIIESAVAKLEKKYKEETEPLNEKQDNSLYENAYLTMNRDYESEEELLDETKKLANMTMHDVELREDADTEEIEFITEDETKEFVATSAVSTSASKKSSFSHRCRLQSSRLLACWRGWWRKRTPGKLKSVRKPMPPCVLCPKSPDGRRRSFSLRNTPSVSGLELASAAWKYETVNEALVYSSRRRWREYDVKPLDE